MTAPTLTARTTPGGIKLGDGFSSKIAFALDSNIELYEIEVQPPGIDGGEAISTTTMHNVAYRTKAPRSLIEATDSTIKAAYDPIAYTSIKAIVNRRGSITVHFPDGSTYTFYGYLRSFVPDSMVEGTMPVATVVIVETDEDPVAHTEVGPVLVEVTGT